jgi:hypothetical protein
LYHLFIWLVCWVFLIFVFVLFKPPKYSRTCRKNESNRRGIRRRKIARNKEVETLKSYETDYYNPRARARLGNDRRYCARCTAVARAHARTQHGMYSIHACDIVKKPFSWFRVQTAEYRPYNVDITFSFVGFVAPAGVSVAVPTHAYQSRY